jgi:preprotein translocase subunit SecA
MELVQEKAEEITAAFAPDDLPPAEWDLKGAQDAVYKQFNLRLKDPDPESLEAPTSEALSNLIFETAKAHYDERESAIGAEDFRQLERMVMLQSLDNQWKDHLLSMDHLKEGIGLRGYAQQNPLLIYKKEGFEMFQDMIYRIHEDTLGILYRIQIAEPERIETLSQPREQEMVFSGGEAPATRKPAKRKSKKVGRNAPCPCGSGKKYKKCCGR